MDIPFRDKGSPYLLLFYRQIKPSREEKKEVYTRSQEQQPSPPAAPKFGFQSVDPQPIRSRKTYAQRVEEETKERQKMQEVEELNVPSSLMQGNDQEGGEEMSAYDRVMARSRRQGEGLNQFFGSVMAKRAGQPTAPVDNETTPEAIAETQETIEGPVEEEEEEEEEEEQPVARVPRSQEEIDGMNNWLGDAWEKRLKEMGHSAKGGSPYAKLRVGKGKERQESNAAE